MGRRSATAFGRFAQAGAARRARGPVCYAGLVGALGRSWESARRWAAASSFAWAVELGATLASAGVPTPTVYCNSSAECPACGICVSGTCSLGERRARCRCDDECTVYGFAACEPDRPNVPLCGGACVDAAGPETLACGEGQDAWVMESASAPFEGVPIGAAISAESIEPASATAYPELPSAGERGCTLAGRPAADGRAWALLLALMVIRRRR